MSAPAVDLAPFKGMIQTRCGLRFEGSNEEKLVHALVERQRLTGLARAADYLRLAQSSDGEFQELVNLLTINETYFFREPEQIGLLTDHLVPRLLATRGGGAPIRILSAGCSSGEEPYSLVMALWEKYGEQTRRLFTFMAGDIDSQVLAKARQGRYAEFSFRGVPVPVRERYFQRDGWSYVLKPEIREQVQFQELNLLAQPFPPAFHSFDVIFFRNVSIYFDAPTRKVIQQNLASLLRDEGFLVIGTAETLANDLGVLPLVEDQGLFYFVKGQGLAPPQAGLTPFGVTSAAPALPSPGLPLLPEWPEPVPPINLSNWEAPALPPIFPPPLAMPQPTLAEARHLIDERRYDEALPRLEALVDGPDGEAARLLKAYVQINRKAFSAAAEAAQAVLQRDPWSVDALLLAGLAAKWQQQTAAAIQAFKQAAYVRHECWPAHYYLADLYRQQGEEALAQRAYRVVLQLLSLPEPATGITIIPVDLPVGEIRFLCEHQLNKMAGRTPALRR